MHLSSPLNAMRKQVTKESRGALQCGYVQGNVLQCAVNLLMRKTCSKINACKTVGK